MQFPITAHIGGAQYICVIHREDLRTFEALHGSAFELLKKITAGAWTEQDIRDVINFATGPRPKKVDDGDSFTLMSLIANKGRAKTKSGIEAAIIENGIGTYTALAMAILTSALFGLSVEASVFSDSVPALGDHVLEADTAEEIADAV